MPPDPLEHFLFLNKLQICSAEKNTLEKNVEIVTPSPFKISRYATESQYLFNKKQRISKENAIHMNINTFR